MKKSLKKQLSIFLATALLLSVVFVDGAAPVVAESTNPAPTDSYYHTVMGGMEYLNDNNITKSGFVASTGDTTAEYLAYGSTKAIKFSFNALGYGAYVGLYSGSKSVRTGVMPADLSAYGGMRFYLAVNNLKTDATTGELTDSLPAYLSIRLVDETGTAIADAKIPINSAEEHHHYKQWVYLEPSNFLKMEAGALTSTTLTSFPKAHSFEIRVSSLHSQYDNYKMFEGYFSGLSFYTKNPVNTTNPQRNDGYVHTELMGIDSLTSSNVSGVKTDIVTENVANGRTKALKASFVKDGWPTYSYVYSSANAIPGNIMPTKLSEYEGISLFLTVENNNYDGSGTITDSLPQYVEFVLVDSSCTQVAEAWVPMSGTNRKSDHLYQGWVYLEPSDFYVVTYTGTTRNHPTSSTAKLTAFPDAPTFAIMSRNISNTDAYKVFNVYVSGMSAYVKTQSTNPAPTDGYEHTYLSGIEEASQSVLDTTSKTSNITLTAGVTDSKYVAYGADSAVKISLNGTVGWGQLFFYQESGGTRTAISNGSAQNLANAHGIRFFLKAEGNLPKSIQFVTVNQYNSVLATATVNISGTDVESGAWIYLEPEDFVDSNNAALTAFTSTLAFGIKITGNNQSDGYKVYDMYLSGLSQYVKTSNPAPTDDYTHTAMNGFENLSQAVADTLSKTQNITFTAGITAEKYVAHGATNAMKLTYDSTAALGWGQFLVHETTSGNREIPAGAMVSNLSEYDGIRFWLEIEGSQMPATVTFKLLNSYYGDAATKAITIGGSSYQGWVYLTPEDFGISKFPNAKTFGISLGAGKFDMYISGMTVYTDPNKIDTDVDNGAEDTTPNPLPTDNYIHTALNGFDTVTDSQIGYGSNIKVTTGVTEKSYLGKDAIAAFKFLYDGTYGTTYGQINLNDASKVVPSGFLPTNGLKNYDGIRFYMEVYHLGGSVPDSFELRMLNQYYMNISGATKKVEFDIDSTSKMWCGWVYITPEDLGMTIFPDVRTFTFNPSGNSKYSVYLSSLSVYKVSNTDSTTMPKEPVDEYSHVELNGLDNITASNVIVHDNVTLTEGITDKKHVAYGEDSALKISYNTGSTTDGWGQVIFFNNQNKTYPEGMLPENLSDYDGIRFYLKAEAVEGNLPNSISIHMADENLYEVVSKTINIQSGTGEYGNWIYLRPSDFDLLVFDDYKSFTIKMDGYSKYNLYISGLSAYYEDGFPQAAAAAPVSPGIPSALVDATKATDTYLHTKITGFDTLKPEEVLVTDSVKVITGITDKEYLAPDAANGILLRYDGSTLGWGQAKFMTDGTSGIITPKNILPSNMSDYDGVRFYIKTNANTLPTDLIFAFINEYGEEAGTANIKLKNGAQGSEGWVYLTARDFDMLMFDDFATYAIKMGGYSKYDIYISELSAYRENGGSLNGASASGGVSPNTGDVLPIAVIVLLSAAAFSLPWILLGNRKSRKTN